MSAQTAVVLSFPVQIPPPGDWKILSDEELVTIYREHWGTHTREDAAAELFLRHQSLVLPVYARSRVRFRPGAGNPPARFP
jgi:hypothetical protein